MRELVTGVAARWDKVAAHSLSIGKFSFLGGGAWLLHLVS